MQPMLHCQLKTLPQGFLATFPPTTDNKILHAYCRPYVHTQNSIQLSLTLTKLCHIKLDHLVNLYVSLEKRKKIALGISVQQYDQSPQNLARRTIGLRCEMLF